MYEKMSKDIKEICASRVWSIEDFQHRFFTFLLYEFYCRESLKDYDHFQTLSETEQNSMFEEYISKIDVSRSKKTKALRRFIGYMKWLERQDK